MNESSQSEQELLVPPADLHLPAELQGPSPRPLPSEINDGRLATQREKLLWAGMTVGAICAIVSFLPFMDTLALYVLPLGYLVWIGLGICVLTAAVYYSQPPFNKAKAYIETGEAGFALVTDLAKAPTAIMNGQVLSLAFNASLAWLDSESGVAEDTVVKSNDFSPDQRDLISTRFRVGDWVPVVWMPGRKASTLQIYDFLEIVPEAGLIRRDENTPLWKSLLIISAIVLFFFSMIWNIYSLGKFEPLDFEYKNALLPVIFGGCVGFSLCTWNYFRRRGQRKRREQANAKAVISGDAIEVEYERSTLMSIFYGLVMTAGAMMICAATALSMTFATNALLDESPPQPVPVQIDEMFSVTHNFLFREYKLEYRFLDDAEDQSQSMITTPTHMNQFAFPPRGVAQVRDGYFGWPWVATIDPIGIEQEP